MAHRLDRLAGQTDDLKRDEHLRAADPIQKEPDRSLLSSLIVSSGDRP